MTLGGDEEMKHCKPRFLANSTAIVLASLLVFLVNAAVAQDQPTTGEFLQDLLSNFGRPSDADGGETDYSDSELVKRTADDVLDSPEFRGLPQLDLDGGAQARQADPDEPLLRMESSSRDSGGPIGGGFADFLRSLFGGAVSILIAMLIVLVAGGIVAAIFYIARSWKIHESSETGEDDATDDEPAPLVAAGDKSPDAWLAAARQAAAAGRFEEAISLLLLGAMGHAERAGLIRPRRGLTHRDYLRVVPTSSAWHAALDRLIRTYAPIGFGRRSADSRLFHDVAASYETALAAEPVITAPERSA